jgi:hypothetical protein
MAQCLDMKQIALTLTFIALSSPLYADCYADYKAKMDNPLRLHYGVIRLPDSACLRPAASAAITQRVLSGGWQFLELMSIFDESGLAARRNDAGQYYLRF